MKQRLVTKYKKIKGGIVRRVGKIRSKASKISLNVRARLKNQKLRYNEDSLNGRTRRRRRKKILLAATAIVVVTVVLYAPSRKFVALRVVRIFRTVQRKIHSLESLETSDKILTTDTSGASELANSSARALLIRRVIIGTYIVLGLLLILKGHVDLEIAQEAEIAKQLQEELEAIRKQEQADLIRESRGIKYYFIALFFLGHPALYYIETDQMNLCHPFTGRSILFYPLWMFGIG